MKTQVVIGLVYTQKETAIEMTFYFVYYYNDSMLCLAYSIQYLEISWSIQHKTHNAGSLASPVQILRIEKFLLMNLL